MVVGGCGGDERAKRIYPAGCAAEQALLDCWEISFFEHQASFNLFCGSLSFVFNSILLLLLLLRLMLLVLLFVTGLDKSL